MGVHGLLRPKPRGVDMLELIHKIPRFIHTGMDEIDTRSNRRVRFTAYGTGDAFPRSFRYMVYSYLDWSLASRRAKNV